jgi:hypothetical protein
LAMGSTFYDGLVPIDDGHLSANSSVEDGNQVHATMGNTPLTMGNTPLTMGNTPLTMGNVYFQRRATPLRMGNTPLTMGKTPLTIYICVCIICLDWKPISAHVCSVVHIRKLCC